VVDAPAWLKEATRGGDRATLAPAEREFLESVPSYDEVPLPSLPPPPALPKPSMARRIVATLLFVVIATGACAVLGLALLGTGKLMLP
jgi:hypothetical protein